MTDNAGGKKTNVTQLCMHVEDRERALAFLAQLATEDSDLRNQLHGPKFEEDQRIDVKRVLAEWGIFIPLENVPHDIELPPADDLRQYLEHFSENANPFAHYVFVMFLALSQPNP